MNFSELCGFTERQWQATETADRHKYTLFGGSRGPGKSYWLRWYLVRRLLKAVPELPRLRLSSLDPAVMDEALFEAS